MKLKQYFNLNFIGPGLFIVILLIFNVNCSNKHGISNFEDDATFKLYVRETPVATIVNSIDRQGNYHRKITIAMAGQQVEMTMDITPDQFGDWEKIKIINPMYGTMDVKHIGRLAKGFIKNKIEIIAKLPENYTFYDDYGKLFESVMLKKYDMNKKGKQVFQRFRIPENPSAAGFKTNFPIELQFLEQKKEP
jgi:hypothetical protein